MSKISKKLMCTAVTGKNVYYVCDAQSDFCGEDGVLSSKASKEAVPHIVAKIKALNPEKDVIIASVDTHYAETYLNTQEGKYLPVPHCYKDSKGWEIHPDIMKAIEESGCMYCIVEKEQFGYTKWADFCLGDALSFTAIGFVSDICVSTNIAIVKAFFPELSIQFIANCSAGVTPAKHVHAMDILRSWQVEVI